MLAWLSAWSEVQTCICPRWCHCHSLSLASVKSRLILPFWYRLTRVVPEKEPLNGCVYALLSCFQFSHERYLGLFDTFSGISKGAYEGSCPRVQQALGHKTASQKCLQIYVKILLIWCKFAASLLVVRKKLSSRKITTLQGWQLDTAMIVYLPVIKNRTVGVRPTWWLSGGHTSLLLPHGAKNRTS